MSCALVVGSANADLVYSVAEFPQPGETITSLKFGIYAGGKGANQAVACANAGANVEFCACLGNDEFGDFLADSIKRKGLAMNYAKSVEAPTGSAVIFVNQGGENQIVLNPGANHFLTHDDVIRAITSIQPQYILTQLEVTDDAISAVIAHKEKAILNPAPYKNLSNFDLKGLFAITPNESECAALTGIRPSDEHSTREAANALLNMGIQNAIITLGSRGCYWSNGKQECSVIPPKVKPVDTTGAGDVFNGALLSQLISKNDFPSALKFAVAAASLSTTRFGALTSAPAHDEIHEFLQVDSQYDNGSN